MIHLVKKFFINNLGVVILFIIVITIFIFVSRKYHKIENEGRITIARVLKREKYASGGSLTIEIHFLGKIYRTKTGSFCMYCINKYLFVRVLAADPARNVIVYDTQFVPDCILDRPLPDSGWVEIPHCYE